MNGQGEDAKPVVALNMVTIIVVTITAVVTVFGAEDDAIADNHKLAFKIFLGVIGILFIPAIAYLIRDSPAEYFPQRNQDDPAELVERRQAHNNNNNANNEPVDNESIEKIN